MKFSLPSLLLLTCFTSVTIADVIPSYIVYYPYGTPEATKAQAKDIIIKSGGTVFYEYKNLNGFAATIPKEVMDSVQSLGDPQINEDRVAHLDGKSGSGKASSKNLEVI